MNKIFLIIFAAILTISSVQVNAQDNKSDRQFDKEAFQAKRNAFISAEMELTPEEAAVFIPLCDELRRKKFEIGIDCRKLSREVRRRSDLSDADYLRIIDECVEVGIKEAELEKEYYEQFKKILPPKKLYKYRDAEFRFARHFMKMEGHGNPQSLERNRRVGEGSKR